MRQNKNRRFVTCSKCSEKSKLTFSKITQYQSVCVFDQFSYLNKNPLNYSIGLRLFIVSNQYIIQRQIEIKSTLFVCTCYVSYFLKSKGVRIENETRYTRKSIHMETGSKCIKNVIWFASDKLLSINFNGAKYTFFCSAFVLLTTDPYLFTLQ